MVCLWMCCLDVKFSTSKLVHPYQQVHLWVISLDKTTVFFLLSSFPIIPNPVPASSFNLLLSYYLVAGFPFAFTCQSLACSWLMALTFRCTPLSELAVLYLPEMVEQVIPCSVDSVRIPRGNHSQHQVSCTLDIHLSTLCYVIIGTPLFVFQNDIFLRHYDKGPCRNKLGHSRASVMWNRTQVCSTLREHKICWSWSGFPCFPMPS